MLANTAVPILGLTDTAVIGHWGSAQDLAALATGTVAATFIFWNFGFLRMSTTALVARSLGERNSSHAAEIIARAVIIAFAISAVIIVLKALITPVMLALLGPPADAYAATREYLSWRLWSAPATLLMFIVSAILLAHGRSKSVLMLQFFTCSLNAFLDIYLVSVWHLGAKGVAMGTVIAEYIALGAGIFLVSRNISFQQLRHAFRNMSYRYLAFKPLMRSNRDIWLRTLFLLASFMVFTHLSASFGTVTLAANHLLLQLISFSAFFLDGYAHIIEAEIGHALGQQSKERLRALLKKGWLLSQGTALLLATLLFTLAPWYLPLLTDIAEIRVRADELLIFCCCYVALSASAFQLDGVFIGANASSALRNGSILASVFFVGSWFLAGQFAGILGLWLCFIGYVVMRAIVLAAYLPKLEQQANR